VHVHEPDGELSRASLAEAERWARARADRLIAAGVTQ
jgi:1-deoxy-D-xylulose-5-phosphate reductoisomerase